MSMNTSKDSKMSGCDDDNTNAGLSTGQDVAMLDTTQTEAAPLKSKNPAKKKKKQKKSKKESMRETLEEARDKFDTERADLLKKARHVDNRKLEKNAVSMQGMVSKYTTLQGSRDTTETEAELDAKAKTVLDGIRKPKLPVRVPASEDTSEILVGLPKLTSEEQDENDGKRQKFDKPIHRFALGAAVNERKGDPARAHEYLTIRDLGRVGGRVLPGDFKTNMLDEEVDALDDALVARDLTLPPITLTDADRQAPTDPQYRVNTADVHKILLALGRGDELDGHWAWQAWKRSELDRGKTEEQFNQLVKRFESATLPTPDALTDRNYTLWKDELFNRESLGLDEIQVAKLSVSMIMAISQDLLRYHVVGSGRLPDTYIPVWAISVTIGRLFKHIDKIDGERDWGLLTMLGDADALDMTTAPGVRVDLDTPDSRIGKSNRREFRKAVRGRLFVLINLAVASRCEIMQELEDARAGDQEEQMPDVVPEPEQMEL